MNKFKDNLADDIITRRRRKLNSDNVQYDQNIFDEALFELNKVVHFGVNLWRILGQRCQLILLNQILLIVPNI